MQTRSFDLLTAPIAPGESTQTTVNLSWAKPRNFVVAPAAGITFTVDATGEAGMDDGSMVLEVHVTNKGDKPARFAAIVTCDTDETDPQAPRDFAADWPALVVEG